MRLSGSWQQTQCTAELSLRPILMSGGSLKYYITVFNSYCSHECILYFPTPSLKLTGVHAWCFPSASLSRVVSDLLAWRNDWHWRHHADCLYFKTGQKLFLKFKIQNWKSWVAWHRAVQLWCWWWPDWRYIEHQQQLCAASERINLAYRLLQ